MLGILLCWFIIEAVIIFSHISLMIRLLGDDAFLRNSPAELLEKIILVIFTCAFISASFGIVFFRLATL